MSFSVGVHDGGLDVSNAHDLRLLFHRLNNQLGIILAHGELLETKALDDASRSRAAQVVLSVMDAMETTREIRLKTEPVDS